MPTQPPKPAMDQKIEAGEKEMEATARRQEEQRRLATKDPNSHKQADHVKAGDKDTSRDEVTPKTR